MKFDFPMNERMILWVLLLIKAINQSNNIKVEIKKQKENRVLSC